MPMKLLPLSANKDVQQVEVARKLMRIQETEELAKTTNAKLARAQADFNATLARNRATWATEEEEHAQRVKDMESEVKALENRKEQALIPIYLYKKQADDLVEDAREIVRRAKEKEEQAEFLQEKLEEKLTAVADRENAVALEEKRQMVSKSGLESQRESVKEGLASLAANVVIFHEQQEREEANLATRKKEVALAEINFNAKTEKYARDLEALKIWDAQLKDERAVLDRERARLKL